MARKLKVLCIPDLHAPWVEIKKLSKIYELIEQEKPDVVIQLGDALDMYSYSKFARSHDLCTPREEIEEGRNLLVNMWSRIHKMVPKARKIQLRGNHEARLEKRILERNPECWIILQEANNKLLSFPNVETIQDTRCELEIEGVVYIHGYLTQLGSHAKYLLKPVVHGHSHRGGTVFYNLGGQTIWELDCGYLADPKQIPLQYGATKTTLWTQGCGIVDKWGPRFVSL